MSFRRVLTKAMNLTSGCCIIYLTGAYVGSFSYLVGDSMLPTLQPADIVLVEKVSIRFNCVTKGDILIATSPLEHTELICKRVTKTMDEKISHEPLFPHLRHHEQVPPGHVWLEGDNSDNSKDSRIFGAVPKGLLHSRVFFRIWPPHRFGPIS